MRSFDGRIPITIPKSLAAPGAFLDALQATA
jgi:hypothetical protein